MSTLSKDRIFVPLKVEEHNIPIPKAITKRADCWTSAILEKLGITVNASERLVLAHALQALINHERREALFQIEEVITMLIVPEE